MSFSLVVDEIISSHSVLSQVYSQMPFTYVYIKDTTILVYFDFKYAGEGHSAFSSIMSEGLVFNGKRYPVTPCFPWNACDTHFLEKSKTSTLTEVRNVRMENILTTQHHWFLPNPPRYLW